MSRRFNGQKPPYSTPPAKAQTPYPNHPDLYGRENHVQPPYVQSPRVPPPPQFQHPAQAHPPADGNKYAFEQRDEHDYRPAKKPRGNSVAAGYPGPSPYQAYARPHPGYPQTPQQYSPLPPYPAYGQGVPPPDPYYGPPPPPPANYTGPLFTPPPQPGYFPHAYGHPQHQPYYPYAAPFGQENRGSPQSARNQHNQAKHWQANHGHTNRHVQANHAPAVHGQASHAQAIHRQASRAPPIHRQSSHVQATHGQTPPGQATPGQATPAQSTPGQVPAGINQKDGRWTSWQWKNPNYYGQPANRSDNTSTPAASPAARSDTASAAHSNGGSQTSPGAQMGNGVSVPQTATGLNYDDTQDFEFDNYYSDGDEHVDQNLSLGPVNWNPPRRVKHAIPSLYSQFASNPAGYLSEPDAHHHGSASVYNTAANVEEQSVSIQQSREWDNVKDDPVFSTIPQSGDTISVEQVVANRDQSVAAAGNQGVDDEEEEGEITKEWDILNDNQKSLYSKPKGGSANGHRATPSLDEDEFDDDEPYSPPPAKVRPAAPKFASNEQVDDGETQSPYSPKPHSAESPALRGSESNTVQAANVDSGEENPVAPPGHAAKEPQMDMKKHGLLGKPTIFSIKGPMQPPVDPSNLQKHSPLAKPLEYVRDPAQEDALAKLGVTGDPKPVRGTPGPATNPPPSHAPVPHGELSKAHVHAKRSQGGYGPGFANSSIPPPPPPPPPVEEGNANIPQEDDGKLWSPARSDASGKTQIASDSQEERTEEHTVGTSPIEENHHDAVNEETRKELDIEPRQDASGELHEGLHDTVVKDTQKSVAIGPHEEPAEEIREEPHDAAVKGNQKEVGTGPHNEAAEKAHKGTDDTTMEGTQKEMDNTSHHQGAEEIQGKAQNESHEVSQGEVHEQHRNGVEEDETSAEEEPIVTIPNTSASSISATNVSASNVSASNVSAANVPAANVPAPNVPAPNVPAPNGPAPHVSAPSIPPPNIPAPSVSTPNVSAPVEPIPSPPSIGRQSLRKRKADREDFDEPDDGKKRQKNDTKSRRKGKPPVPVDPAYNIRW